MTPPLKTYYGQAGGAKVFLSREGATDDGTGFTVYAKTRPVELAGASGEAIFSALFLVVTWTMAVALRVTPIVDGVAYDGTNGTTDERQTVTLDAQTTRKSETFLLPTMRRLLDPVDPDITMSRYFMRGTRFQALVESVDELGEGTLIFDGLDLEGKAVTDTKVPV